MRSRAEWSGVEQNGSVGRIRTVTSIGPICGSVITVGLGLGLGLGFGLGLGLGLWIVVYKLLENVTKCGSVT